MKSDAAPFTDVGMMKKAFIVSTCQAQVALGNPYRGAVGRAQGLGPDLGAGGEQRRAMHGIFELAHIAGPARRHQGSCVTSADSGRSAMPFALAYFRAKCCGEFQHVLRPVAQRPGSSG